MRKHIQHLKEFKSNLVSGMHSNSLHWSPFLQPSREEDPRATPTLKCCLAWLTPTLT